MLDLKTDIDSLTNFKRQTAKYVKRMRKTGHPLVLTVNGKAEVVVQDAASYAEFLRRTEFVETIEGIHRGLKDVEEGRTRLSSDVFAELRKKYHV